MLNLYLKNSMSQFWHISGTLWDFRFFAVIFGAYNCPENMFKFQRSARVWLVFKCLIFLKIAKEENLYSFLLVSHFPDSNWGFEPLAGLEPAILSHWGDSNPRKFHPCEPLGGLEPPTHALRMRCSTN